MRITSMDISNKEFKKVIRGYNSTEVDEFLDKVAEDYELLYKENSALKEKILSMTEKIEHYSQMESTIQNTLLLAQNAADQSKYNTQKEAELILKNANETSQNMIDKANFSVLKINDEYDKLKQEFLKFRAKFKNFMCAQLDIFNGLEADIENNYNVETSSEENNVKKIEKIIAKEIDSKIVDNENISEINETNVPKDPVSEIKNFFVKN